MEPTHFILENGSRITIRPIRADDREALQRAFARLSPASRYRRFLREEHELSDATARYLTEVDGTNHVALVATVDSLDLKEEIGLGVARFVRLEGEPEVAEAAITVADEAQGKGIGKLLLRALAQEARALGIRTFRAEVMADNAPMTHILEQAGANVRREADTVLVEAPLDPAPNDDETERTHPLRRLLRAVAELLFRARSAV